MINKIEAIPFRLGYGEDTYSLSVKVNFEVNQWIITKQKNGAHIIAINTVFVEKSGLIVIIHYKEEVDNEVHEEPVQKEGNQPRSAATSTSIYEHLSPGEQWDRYVDDRISSRDIGHEYH